MTSVSGADRVIVFDTTMRDGEQSPGASMSHDEKLELAKILEEMGVDVIEAGFPIASNGDFEAVRVGVILLFSEAQVQPARAVWRQYDGREDVTRGYFAQDDGKWTKRL